MPDVEWRLTAPWTSPTAEGAELFAREMLGPVGISGVVQSASNGVRW
ncbi:hypothetical protein [Micromonospora sp. NBC_00858]|nr:hypothetical protein OG990_04330 [Micromonospora sp. NBC_00858]